MSERDQRHQDNSFRDRLDAKRAEAQRDEEARQHESYLSLFEASNWLIQTVDFDDPADVQDAVGDLYTYAAMFDIPAEIVDRAWDDALASTEGPSGQS